MNSKEYLETLHTEIKPALGCTEPIAVALAVARAREALNTMPESVQIRVSCNILKNAMGVGIPGTGMVGLEIASALSCVAGHSSYGLEVLSGATSADCEYARILVERGLVKVSLKETEKKLYIEAELHAHDHTALCIIEDTHTHISLVILDGVVQMEESITIEHPDMTHRYEMNVSEIYSFVTHVNRKDLDFLKAVISTNDTIANEGLSNAYGMCVGRTLNGARSMEEMTLAEYAASYTAAAADARMAGCNLPVMSTAGSGNQGICASLPVAAVAHKLGVDTDQMLRAEALSQLITIHIKSFIGTLSPLCGCAIASAIGSACGVTLLLGGQLQQIHFAIKNMIADISGLICDGAKASCALKIATAVSSAIQCAQLAMAGMSANCLDGIIETDVEKTIRNLGNLGHEGMHSTDRVILDMMIKSK